MIMIFIFLFIWFQIIVFKATTHYGLFTYFKSVLHVFQTFIMFYDNYSENI